MAENAFVGWHDYPPEEVEGLSRLDTFHAGEAVTDRDGFVYVVVGPNALRPRSIILRGADGRVTQAAASMLAAPCTNHEED